MFGGGGGTGSLVSPCMEHTQCSCPLNVRSVRPCTTNTDDVRNPLLQPVVICRLSARFPNQRRLNSHYPADSEMLYGCAPLMDVLNRTFEDVFCNIFDVRLEQEMEEFREQLTLKLARRG